MNEGQKTLRDHGMNEGQKTLRDYGEENESKSTGMENNETRAQKILRVKFWGCRRLVT